MNEDIREKIMYTVAHIICYKVQRKQLRRFGHEEKLEGVRWLKRYIERIVTGRRKRRRAKRSCKNNVDDLA